MALCRDNGVSSVELYATYGTVNYGVVTAINGTVRIGVILGLFLTGGVTKSGLFIVGGVVASRASLVCVPTNSGTGGSLCLVLYNIVTLCINNGISSLKHLVTFGAVNYAVVATGSSTSGVHVVLNNCLSSGVTNLNGCGENLGDCIDRIELFVCHFKLGDRNGVLSRFGTCGNLNRDLCQIVSFKSYCTPVKPGINTLFRA